MGGVRHLARGPLQVAPGRPQAGIVDAGYLPPRHLGRHRRARVLGDGLDPCRHCLHTLRQGAQRRTVVRPAALAHRRLDPSTARRNAAISARSPSKARVASSAPSSPASPAISAPPSPAEALAPAEPQGLALGRGVDHVAESRAVLDAKFLSSRLHDALGLRITFDLAGERAHRLLRIVFPPPVPGTMRKCVVPATA